MSEGITDRDGWKKLMKIILASIQAVNIDDDTRWCTYNLVTHTKKIVPKAAWPTYAISLIVYRSFYPVDPPIEINSPADIDEALVQEIQERTEIFSAYDKPA